MSLVTTVDHLQTVDLELDEIEKQLHLLQERLSGDPSLVAARAALAAEIKRLDALRGETRDRELETRSLDTKIKSMEERLYSGRVANPKELDGLEKELQMFRRQRSQMDDRLLELLEEIDPVQASADQQAAALTKLEQARAQDVERLEHERDDLAARRATLLAERDRSRTTIGTDPLRMYDRLRKTKSGHAVANIRHSSCGQCGVAVPTGLIQRVHTGEELVFCSSCGRILAG